MQTTPQSTPACTANPSTSKSPVTMTDLLNLVAVKILGKWELFGILLDIPQEELDTFPEHNPKECFIRVFSSWKRKGTPEYSWETIIKTLTMPIMAENRLAAEIEDTLAKKPIPSSSYSLADAFQ